MSRFLRAAALALTVAMFVTTIAVAQCNIQRDEGTPSSSTEEAKARELAPAAPAPAEASATPAPDAPEGAADDAAQEAPEGAVQDVRSKLESIFFPASKAGVMPKDFSF